MPESLKIYTYHLLFRCLPVENITWHGCPGVQLNSDPLVGEGEINCDWKSDFKYEIKRKGGQIWQPESYACTYFKEIDLMNEE